MAGHFNVFRRYQKISLAAVAIMAMLAFFVLPPFLMNGGPAAPNDTVVVRWNGGSLRESDLVRLVQIRRALNRFLVDLRVVATNGQAIRSPLPDDEKSVFELELLAREAEANGIVVSDAVVNSFLGEWTGDRVTSAEMESLIAELRKHARVTEADLFDGLRDVILAGRLESFFSQGIGFNSMPPAARWDAFRKLEQAATVEVVPVVVESLSAEVPTPSTAQLEKLYSQYADALPQARSTTPGFREPARARYEAIVAPADLFVAEYEAKVADEAIEKFYEENKETMYQKVAEPPTPPGDGKASESPVKESTDGTGEGAKPAEAEAPVEGTKPADSVAPATSGDKAQPAGEPKDTSKPSAGASVARGAIRPVKFVNEKKDETPPAEQGQPAAPPAEAAAVAPAAKAPEKAAEPAAETSKQEPPKPEGEGEQSKPEPEAKPAEGEAAKAPVEYQPLDKVRDEIRKQLGQQAAAKKVSEVFGVVTAKIAKYSDDVELAIGSNQPVPSAPDVMKIAAEHGLQGVRSEFVTPSQAAAAGGIGASFQIGFSERFGVRQQSFAELVLAPALPRFRPVTTRDVAGAQFLAWKTEDRPEFTPPLADIKPEVERVWKLLEARPLAKKRAQALEVAAKDKTLADAVKEQKGFAVATVGPFTWLTRGTAPFGSAPTLSDPDGVELAGTAFMEAVFALEPGETTVAYNEPETVCYAIRLVSYEPDDETLGNRFRDTANDPRRIAALAADESRSAYTRWIAEIESRNAVTWLRSPRPRE